MFGLYLLDVFVNQLKLNKEVFIDTGGETLVAKVVFLNFPAAEVVERSRSIKDEITYVYEFKGGQSFHFSITCEELVKKMKKIPVKIGIFRVDDNFPVCHVHTFLRGCACDLGSICVEKPIPFFFRGPFELVDPGQNFAGQVDLEITITNLGKRIIAAFALAPNCFIFKDDFEGTEYKCNSKDTKRLTLEDSTMGMGDYMVDRLLDIEPPGNLSKEIAGVSPTAERLSLGRPPPKVPLPPLIDPETIGKKGKKGKGKKK